MDKRQLEFDFVNAPPSETYQKPVTDYFKQAFDYETLRERVSALQAEGKLPIRPTADQKADWAYGNANLSNPDATLEMAQKAVSEREGVDQKRDNKHKPRQHYALAAPTAHMACGLLFGTSYPSQVYALVEIAWRFMRGDIEGEMFLTEVLDQVEETGAVLYQRVAEFGAKKYDRGNFLKGAPISQYLDSWLRHAQKIAVGEPHDTESGELHLAHIVWNTVEAARWVGHETRDDRLKVSK